MKRQDFPARNPLLALAIGACLSIVAPASLAADAPTPAPAVKPPPKAAAKVPAKGADAKQPEGSPAGGTGSNTLLTREELRQCMTEKDRIKQETADVVQAQAALARDRAEIDSVSAAIDADRAGVNRSDQAAVDAFNERSKARVKLIEAYQAAAPQFNRRVDKLDTDRQAYDKACIDRRYDEKDLEAIKAGR